MKIAIITWFRNYNYGTYLQAFSLQRYLKDNGHDVTLINYRNKGEDVIREPIYGLDVFFNKVKNNIKRRTADRLYKKQITGQHQKENTARAQKMNDFLLDVSFTDEVVSGDDFSLLEEQFDCFICGSDQIWNPKILNGRYYLNFVHSKSKIAYADSFSLSYLPEFSVPYITKWLHNYLAIGMRESTGADLINRLEGMPLAVNVCDPTLLLYEHWKSQKNETKINEPYIFSYFLGNRHYYAKVMRLLVKDMNSKVISIPMNDCGVRCGDIVDYAAGVEDFLAYIQNAQMVCVDSFHAVVFSVIYEKQFIVLNKYKEGDLSSQNSRITDFLRVLGLEERIISESSLHRINKMKPIDYDVVNERLQKFISDSKAFLDNAVRQAKEKCHDM